MGLIYYDGADNPIHIEDRALAHLKVVVATKLRRNESFTLSWTHPEGQPPGRTTIWLHPSIPLRFVFDDPEGVELRADWITAMANSANSSGGITLVSEDLVPASELATAGGATGDGADGSQPPDSDGRTA
ncbi:DUF7882 family protein [Microbacterium sp. SZ1]|uniref:DUF7882 family protein n=1 Tax=Microbacterium sp. SZ1 TaxID=1849736 RepID=UPI00211CC43A|nr:hypothetical protein [Microbacterium sp. SZ1]